MVWCVNGHRMDKIDYGTTCDCDDQSPHSHDDETGEPEHGFSPLKHDCCCCEAKAILTWNCDECFEGYCKECVDKQANSMLCPKSHEMKFIEQTDQVHSCDTCKDKDNILKAPFYHCDICDYSLCLETACATPALKPKSFAKGNIKTPAGNIDPEEVMRRANASMNKYGS